MHVIEVFEGNDGQWYVRIKARNGRVLFSSEGYTRKRDALRMAFAFRSDVEAAGKNGWPLPEVRLLSAAVSQRREAGKACG